MKRPTGNEGSHYWNWVSNRYQEKRGSGWGSFDGRMPEDAEANPDMLPDTTNVFTQKSELSDEQEEALSSYYKLVDAGILKRLSDMQRKVWKLRFFNWESNEVIAEKLGLTTQAVQSHLHRAGQKIKAEVMKDVRRKQIREGNYFASGFKKRTDTVGHTNTDAEFEQRIEQHQGEIDAFLRVHPELRREV